MRKKKPPKKKKKIVYFVSYFWASKDSNMTGFGSIRMASDTPIREYSDIKNIIEWLNENIKDKNGRPIECVILNYQKLRS